MRTNSPAGDTSSLRITNLDIILQCFAVKEIARCISALSAIYQEVLSLSQCAAPKAKARKLDSLVNGVHFQNKYWDKSLTLPILAINSTLLDKVLTKVLSQKSQVDLSSLMDLGEPTENNSDEKIVIEPHS